MAWQMQLRETVMADESDDHRSHARKLGDDVRQFIDEVKPFTDFLPLAVKIAAFLGGASVFANTQATDLER